MKIAVPALIIAALAAFQAPAWGLDGNSLAVRSNGMSAGTSWTLQDNGYVGTYIDVPTAGLVSISVNASGLSSGGINPHMNIVVDDFSAGFDVPAGSNTYPYTFDLPAGKHFIRTEFPNDPGKTSRQLTVEQFNIVSGATIDNTHTNANALAASNNYIANFRKGPAEVALLGATPGAPVHAKLVNHAFNFGANFPGSSPDGPPNYIGNANFTSFLKNNFNAVVPSNAGKWANNEKNDQMIDLAYANQIRAFAEANDMRYRMHALTWGNQNPGFIQSLVDSAAAGDVTAKNSLRTQISQRIDYYVGDADANTNDNDPAKRYFALDVLNEHVNQPQYFQAFTPAELASIFSETKEAIDRSGAPNGVGMFLNEFNVLQNGADSFGNWYRAGADAIVNAGGHLDGLGVQYYVRGSTVSGQQHSPARILQTLQNLSVGGFDLTLTEFGIQQNTSDPNTNERPDILEDSMRMFFGTPQADGFFDWGFWAGGTSSLQADGILINNDFSLTKAGTRYQQLMNEWNTDANLNVLPDGTVDFTGFYGEYEVTVGGNTYTLDLTKGDTDYSLVVGPPSADFDLDGDIDGNDFLTWQLNRGAINADFAQGDANYDGFVDGDDLQCWEMQFGTAPLSANSTAVPEPGTLALAMVALCSFASRRRQQPSK